VATPVTLEPWHAELSRAEKRRRIVEKAESYLGVPYVFGGKDYGGIDCSGLVKVAYRAAGIKLGGNSHLKDYGSLGREVPLSEAQPGDIMHRVSPPYDHVGLVTEAGVIHAVGGSRRRVVVDSFERWCSRRGCTVRDLIGRDPVYAGAGFGAVVGLSLLAGAVVLIHRWKD
jgi:cell wall-associated NlpC family hydrolase